MNCCHKCFKDTRLIQIALSISQITGDCDFCNSKGIAILAPSELEDHFQPILDLYVQSVFLSEGDLIEDPLLFHEQIQLRWDIFDMENPKIKELTLAIFEGQLETNSNQFSENVVIGCLNSDGGEEEVQKESAWREFVRELKTSNRFFPEKVPDLNLLEVLFRSHEKEYPIGKRVYRARTSEEGGIPLEKMGIPPPKKATGGRANPVGIPYLYAALDEDTPLYEVRAGINDFVTIAEFKTKEKLRIIPLRDFSKVSPFDVADDLESFLINQKYLLMLERELARPIRKQDQELDYLSTQYLCEFVKRVVGSDGVEYSSSMHRGGVNVVLFDEDKLEPVKRDVFRIDDIQLVKTKL